MIQNPKPIKEILDKFNSKKKKVLHGKLTKTDQNSNEPSQKINDKLGKKIYLHFITQTEACYLKYVKSCYKSK